MPSLLPKADQTFNQHPLSTASTALISCLSSTLFFYSFTGLVGSSPKIPPFTNSSAFGLCWIFCSKLSARMCLASSRCFSCSEGAAVESGSMLPGYHHIYQYCFVFNVLVLGELWVGWWRKVGREGERRTLYKFFLLRTLFQPFFQAVDGLLAL